MDSHIWYRFHVAHGNCETSNKAYPIFSRHWWRITLTFGHARSSAWPSCGSRDFHVACRAVWRTPQLSLRWGLTTYGNLEWLGVTQVVRCFGFGMSLRRMANLKAMEFCVEKKRYCTLLEARLLAGWFTLSSRQNYGWNNMKQPMEWDSFSEAVLSLWNLWDSPHL